MSIRDEKSLSRLTHIAGAYIAREAGHDSLITVTRAEISPDRKNATVFVSVFPDNKIDVALAFLARHRDGFREYMKKEGRFSVLPFVTFEYDRGEEHRRHIEDLSKEL